MSDRFALLSPKSWWADKKVVLLDDTSWTGDTLRTRGERLKRLEGPRSIEARPAVDLSSQEFNRDSVRDRLHLMYAEAFGEALVPYFTDFPISAQAAIALADLDGAWRTPGWKVVDVSNSAVQGGLQKAYTLFPDANTLEPLYASHPALRSLTRVAKLRVFVRHADDRTAKVRVVPIILLNRISAASGRRAASSMGFHTGNNLDVLGQAIGYITYLIAMRLLSFAATIMPQLFDSEALIDADSARLVLGPALHDQMGEHLGCLDSALAELSVESNSEGQTDSLVIAAFSTVPDVARTADYFGIGDDLAKPAYRVFNRLTRSDRGLDIADLAENIGGNDETASLSLDVLNDLGLVVPEVAIHDGVVRRVFRPGEVRPRHLLAGPLGGQLARVARTYAVTSQAGISETTPLFPEA